MQGSPIHVKPISAHETHSPDNSGGIFHKTQIVHYPNSFVKQIAPATKGINQPAKVPSRELESHAVDSEIPAIEIVDQSTGHDGRQGTGTFISLTTGRDHVDFHLSGKDHQSRGKPTVKNHLSPIPRNKLLGKGHPIPGYYDVQIHIREVQQQIPYAPSHQKYIYAHLLAHSSYLPQNALDTRGHPFPHQTAQILGPGRRGLPLRIGAVSRWLGPQEI
jgi:hypothetical protein